MKFKAVNMPKSLANILIRLQLMPEKEFVKSKMIQYGKSTNVTWDIEW